MARMECIKNRLKSDRGASITFALLLFLVCAIISSVVIVAGTTAAGRMSRQAKTDQRYYAVTSVAKLLKSEIDGQTIIVEPVTDDEGNTTYRALYAGEDAPRDTILADASSTFVRRIDNPSESEGGPETREYTVYSDLDATEHPNVDLECDVVETIGDNGLLTFNIANSNEPPYQLKLVFSSNRKESADIETGVKRTTLQWNFLSVQKLGTR